MIRLSALWLTVFGLAAYSRKDWYLSLCGLIVLMTVIEHPDAPRTMFGIQGLNFWNVLLAVVVVAWFRARRREGLTWDLPRGVTLGLLAYAAVILVGFLRMLSDQSYLGDETTGSLVSEYLVNTFKWVVPALLLFDGCRTRERFMLGLGAILSVYVLLGLYVIKWMPLSVLTSGDDMQERSLKILVNEIGYHRVTMSMMLAGASWAVFSARGLMTDRRAKILVCAAAAAIMFAQSLTGGRMGYITWAFLGLVFLVIRDRAILLLAPFALGAVLLLVPAVGERFMEGFGPGTGQYAIAEAERSGAPVDPSQVDVNTITAGRTLIWPYVQEKIWERPVTGHGMLAMRRTGLASYLRTTLDEGFDHPHNAFFEWTLDNGFVGLVLVMPFYIVVVWRSLRLYADSRSPVFVAIGGATTALVLALLIAGLGSQSFYPREGTVGMWCAIGLMFRVWVERERLARPARTTVSVTPVIPPIAWADAPTDAAAARKRVAPTVHARAAVSAHADVDHLLWQTS